MSYEKATLKEWILEEAAGEPILAVVIGEMGWGGVFCSERIEGYDTHIRGKVLTWEAAEPFLSYQFDYGFGAPECEAVYVWTETKVMFVTQYDGSTCLDFVPRHPIDCDPAMPGG
jgi:hypothetical protein